MDILLIIISLAIYSSYKSNVKLCSECRANRPSKTGFVTTLNTGGGNFQYIIASEHIKKKRKSTYRVSKHCQSLVGTASQNSMWKNIQTTRKPNKNSSFKWHVYTRITERDRRYISTCIYLTLFRVAAGVLELTRIKYRVYRWHSRYGRLALGARKSNMNTLLVNTF